MITYQTCPRCGYGWAGRADSLTTAERYELSCRACGLIAMVTSKDRITKVKREPHPQMIKLSKVFQELLDDPFETHVYSRPPYDLTSDVYRGDEFYIAPGIKGNIIASLID